MYKTQQSTPHQNLCGPTKFSNLSMMGWVTTDQTATVKERNRFTQVLQCRVGTLTYFILPLGTSNKDLSFHNSAMQRVKRASRLAKKQLVRGREGSAH